MLLERPTAVDHPMILDCPLTSYDWTILRIWAVLYALEGHHTYSQPRISAGPVLQSPQEALHTVHKIYRCGSGVRQGFAL